MSTRLELQSKLEELLETRNVYYQPPASIQMVYPAIRYSKVAPDLKRANNAIYLKKPCYQVIVISKSPDHPVIDKLLALPYCAWDRHYISDNLNHDAFTLYY